MSFQTLSLYTTTLGPTSKTNTNQGFFVIRTAKLKPYFLFIVFVLWIFRCFGFVITVVFFVVVFFFCTVLSVGGCVVVFVVTLCMFLLGCLAWAMTMPERANTKRLLVRNFFMVYCFCWYKVTKKTNRFLGLTSYYPGKMKLCSHCKQGLISE